eukprot:TRINITY_DN2094_c0_g1_i2.p1 TRINITY_DN2094_c0_g1~~TRINITY_DN2094_c0_g1_i2.p1  ORF type:complete len:1234 (+),score=363.51 TRINITY_DN2094_c0_g1_i2:119-3820(+)
MELVPKREIEALDFLKNHPQYDGRGVTVAIFDTGVDPGAPGLQTTSYGKPKLVDIVDCTGDGDVDVSMVKELETDGTLIGLSGRKLTLGKWTNPTGKYRIGLKRTYGGFFPTDLVDRLREERKRKFDIQQRIAKTEIQREIEATSSAAEPQKSSPEFKKTKKDLELRLESLGDLEKSYEDPGPIYDCVVFHDGTHFRAVVDTTETGDLTEAKVLTDFDVEHEFATFSEVDLLNFGVHFYDEGKTLSIVVHSGSHGTHVAGITGAFLGENHPDNGVAPGCQMVSIKIGDQRVKHEETVPAMIRGLSYVIRHKVDLINMSFGEGVTRPNVGRFVDLARAVVHKHDVIFVSSAGNSGPALTTVGSPGGTTAGLLGVGAYVSHEMMGALYSLRESHGNYLNEWMYSWSSRGPTADGDIGVSIVAPGGAITCIPNSNLKKNQLMNGTSMASPNAVGGIALVLSGLKAEGIRYRPASVQRALENSARNVEGVETFALGSGLIQVNKAFDYHVKNTGDVDIRYDVTCSGNRGIYLRNFEESEKPSEFSVNVRAVFHESVANREKITYEKRVTLKSTQPWIDVPKFLALSGEKAFPVRIDPSRLQVSRVHFGYILGFDESSPNSGPLFKFPVTVIRPLPIPSRSENVGDGFSVSLGEMTFKSGHIERRFVKVPEFATSVDIRVKAFNVDANRMFMIHALQLIPHRDFRDYNMEKMISVGNNDEETFSCKVVGGFTIEITLAQFWSNTGTASVKVDVDFHGVKADCSAVNLNGNELMARVDLRSGLRPEKLALAGNLTKWWQYYRPASATVRPLFRERDELPDGKQISELLLTYNFKIDESCEIDVSVPVISATLYDGAVDGQLLQVLDSNKRVIGWGDAWPSHYVFKVGKGDYTVRLQLRHDSLDVLDLWKEIPVGIERKLTKQVPLKFYPDANSAITDGTKFDAGKKLKFDDRVPLYVRVDESALPKELKAGDQLKGTITLQKNTEVEFTYGAPTVKSASSTGSSAPENPDEESLTESEKMENSIWKAKLDHLTKLVDKKKLAEFEKLVEEYSEKKTDNLQLLQLRLKAIEASESGEQKWRQLRDIADEIAKKIDAAQLSQHFGVRLDPDDVAANRVRKDFEKQKEALVDAIYKKGTALVASNADKEELENTMKELKKWIDVDDLKYLELNVTFQRQKNLLGHSLKTLKKHLEASSHSDPVKQKLLDKQVEIVKELGWEHWTQYLQAWKLIRYPPQLPPF